MAASQYLVARAYLERYYGGISIGGMRVTRSMRFGAGIRSSPTKSREKPSMHDEAPAIVALL